MARYLKRKQFNFKNDNKKSIQGLDILSGKRQQADYEYYRYLTNEIRKKNLSSEEYEKECKKAADRCGI